MTPHSGERVIQCTQINSIGGIVIVVEFEPMSVHQSSCKIIASATNGNAVIPYPGVILQLGAAFIMNASNCWGCGVMDSTVGFEPINPGSIPGTFTSITSHTGYSVVDIMAVCEGAYPGSNPGTPTK